MLYIINLLTKLLEKRDKKSLINILFSSHVRLIKLIELIILISISLSRAFKLSYLARKAL